jgi:hypothetical protein
VGRCAKLSSCMHIMNVTQPYGMPPVMSISCLSDIQQACQGSAVGFLTVVAALPDHLGHGPGNNAC